MGPILPLSLASWFFIRMLTSLASLAIWSSTRRKWAAVFIISTLRRWLAQARVCLSWAASCAESLERPAAAPAWALAAFWSNMATALLSALVAALALLTIWAAFLCTALSV